MANLSTQFLMWLLLWTASTAIFLLIAWAIIRGAVLSALRKIEEEKYERMHHNRQ